MNIVLTGSLAVDQIMNFDGLFEDIIQPDKIHILSISVLLKELRRTRGGIAANIAYSLALLGESPILFGSIGKDEKGYMQELEKLGVNISHLHYSDLPTATFNVITDRNDCQVGGFYPGAMGDARNLSIHKFQQEDVFVVISAHDPQQMGVQIDECVQLKKRLFFDIGQQVIVLPKEVLLKGLQCAELLILNDYEMGVLSKKVDIPESEIIRMVDTCVITLGEKGAKVFNKKNDWQEERVSAISIKDPVDPTGAGDAFRAGFLYGYVRNWQTKKCVQLGCTVAAYAVEKQGTQEHFFTETEIAQRYTKSYQQELKL